MSAAGDWRPSASRERLALRAALFARARAFFAARQVLEVDTPVMVNAAVTDVHIHAVPVQLHLAASAPPAPEQPPAPLFLHTSPEYAMKRLLAAGSGDIYQICHVVRGFEKSRMHNPEFTLIEWYRLGFTLEALMEEVESLVRELLGAQRPLQRSERLSYREVFLRELGLDPFTAAHATLQQAAEPLGYRPAGAGPQAVQRDELLDLLMGALIGPRLGRGRLTFVHGYPASQAALARLDEADPATARRFELYSDGLELANGFHELSAAAEQRRRFEQDLQERRWRGLPGRSPDEHLLAALQHGLPDCAGVALGFDRVLMLASGAGHIHEVLPFPTERA